MDMSVISFYVFALVAVAASIGVVGQRNPMHSVMLLITSFGALAGLYVLLDAPFTAVTQIIIYAGAIMVLFLFVVMLLNAGREEPAFGLTATLGPGGLKIGAVLSVLLGDRDRLGVVAGQSELVLAGRRGRIGELGCGDRQRRSSPGTRSPSKRRRS